MADRDHGTPAYLALYVVGGLCTGAGILSMAFSLGWEGGDLNTNFEEVGFSAVDNLSLLPLADFAIPILVCGIVLLVMANAFSWKETDGY